MEKISLRQLSKKYGVNDRTARKWMEELEIEVGTLGTFIGKGKAKDYDPEETATIFNYFAMRKDKHVKQDEPQNPTPMSGCGLVKYGMSEQALGEFDTDVQDISVTRIAYDQHPVRSYLAKKREASAQRVVGLHAFVEDLAYGGASTVLSELTLELQALRDTKDAGLIRAAVEFKQNPPNEEESEDS